MTLVDSRGDAHALVDTLAVALAEVEEVTLGDIRGHVHTLVDTGCRRIRGGGVDTS